MPYIVLNYSFIFTIAVLAGCTTTELGMEDTVFLTKITDTGLKHFELRVKRFSQQQTEPLQLDKNARKKRAEKRPNPKRFKKTLMASANRHIESNGFCQTGYWVIETYTVTQRLKLRGECNEAASESDHQKFPDTIEEW